MTLRLTFLLAVSLCAVPGWGAGVKVLFDPAKPEIGPFPTDYLTAPSTTSVTGKLVRMPTPPDCEATPNACQEAWLLNDFDGFNLQARVRVRFSGKVNAETLREGIYLVSRENLTEDEPGARKTGDLVRLNQIVYDAVTNTAYGKPDVAMDQHRRYLLVVTDAVKDEAGDVVEKDENYVACVAESAEGEYCKALGAAVKTVEGSLAGASLFTTMSATTWLEKARDALENTAPTVSRPAGKSFFSFGQLSAGTWLVQNRTRGGEAENINLPLAALQGTVGAIAFGSYSSPNHLREDRTIGRGVEPQSVEQVPFTAYLPPREKPEKGYPVVIYGHGLGDGTLGGPAAANFGVSQQGFAVISIPAAGHMYGPNSVLLLREADGAVTEVPYPGRGVDLDGNGRIDASEGCAAPATTPFGLRDCLRQTTVDLLQLVRVLRAGLDLDGDGSADLDPTRIYYVGQSLGAMYGTMFLALEPAVKRAVLNSGGGSVVDISRWSPAQRVQAAANLGLRKPSLLNKGRDFEEQYVLRNQPVKVVNDAGAIAIQNAFETLEWLQAEGDPLSYAVHLKPSPLKGVEAKAVLWQYALGDQTVPNPTQTALVRHAGMKDSTWIFRNDLARERASGLDANPHTYLTNLLGVSYQLTVTTLFQVGAFLVDQTFNPNEPIQFFYGNVFEQPEELPEGLNYLEP